MRQSAILLGSALFASVLLAPLPAGAFSLHLGNGSGGLINTGSGNGGVVNLNPGSNNGGVGTGSNPLGSGSGNTDSGLNLDLFGDSTGVSGDALGNGGNQANASLGLGALYDSLFGGADGGAGGGTGGGSGGGVGGGGAGGEVLTASLGGADTAACFMPNRQQLSTLLGRHVYSGNWASGVTSLKVVKVPMCETAVTKVSSAVGADPNLQHLQQSLMTSAWLIRKLAASGYSADHVIAADRSGSTLVLYVV